MKKTLAQARMTIALLAVAAAGLATPAAALADPAKGFPITFTECQGPAGTPSTFDAVLAGFTRALVVDSTSVFVSVVIVRDGIEIYSRPGFDVNGISTITCKFESPLTGFKYVITGFFTPVG
jgi:hypothetical protein